MLQASTIPDNTFKKKNSVISYHFLRENVAAGIIILKYVKTSKNKADMLTKVLGPKNTKDANSMILSI